MPPKEVILAPQKRKRFKCDERDSRRAANNTLIKQREGVPVKLKPHSCKLCDFSTDSNFSLNNHILWHTGEKPYKCDHCSYTCRTKSNVKLHQIYRHSELKTFGCNKCPFQSKTKCTLRSHEKTHFPEKFKTIQCPHCSYLCGNKTMLNRHLTIHSEERPFQCPLCSYKAKTKDALNSHINIHGGIKGFKCKECELSFRTGSGLNSHVQLRHSDVRPFDCPLPKCAGKFKSNAKLRRHIRSVHNKEKNYHCTFCSHSVYDKWTFEEHVRRHTGEKPFKCKLCNFRGCIQGDIIQHVSFVHTHLRSFQCGSCSKSFKGKGQLKRHQELHDMSREFPCKHCNYRGVTRSALQRHDTTFHTSEALKASCRHCKRGYSKRHLKDHERICKAAPKSPERLRPLDSTEKDCRPCSVVLTRLTLTI